MTISKETLDFLKQLAKNNNKDWFNERKPKFKIYQTEVKQFVSEIEARLNKTDQIESHKIFRIYRDVRFSNDKTPFKARFAGSFKRATAARRGGYFINIEPGQSMAGGGFYAPNPADLKRIRQEFEMDDTEIRAILKAPKFKKMFGGLQGDAVKSAPRGFDAEHPAIDLIRMKQFYVVRHFTDKEVLQDNFADQVMDTYKTLRPYFDFMSSVLTTNLDGEEI
jgi:uncharacterized protein (TIGR02453 family)